MVRNDVLLRLPRSVSAQEVNFHYAAEAIVYGYALILAVNGIFSIDSYHKAV